MLTQRLPPTALLQSCSQNVCKLLDQWRGIHRGVRLRRQLRLPAARSVLMVALQRVLVVDLPEPSRDLPADRSQGPLVGATKGPCGEGD